MAAGTLLTGNIMIQSISLRAQILLQHGMGLWWWGVSGKKSCHGPVCMGQHAGVTFFSKDSKGMTHPPLPLSSSQRYFNPNRSHCWCMSDLQQFGPVSRILSRVELIYECFQKADPTLASMEGVKVSR